MPVYESGYTGSFCVFYGANPDSHERVVLLIERGAKFNGTKTEGFGAPGGFVEVANREQPRDGAVREMREEIILPDGSALLPVIDPQRLSLAASGIDYSAANKDDNFFGTVWHGHKCELDETEMRIVDAYAEKMRSDADFAAAVREKSGQELGTVVLIPAGELRDLILDDQIKFAYPHEKQVALAVAKELCCQGHSVRPVLVY